MLIRVVQDASRVPGTIPIAQIATAPLKSQNNSVYTGDRHVISENLRTPDGYITIDADFGGLERGVVRQFLRSVRYAS